MGRGDVCRPVHAIAAALNIFGNSAQRVDLAAFLRADAAEPLPKPTSRNAALLGKHGVRWGSPGTMGCGDTQPTMPIYRGDDLKHVS